MRYVADLIRGRDVNEALDVLAHMPHAAARPLQKLVSSAIKNWELKEEELAREENRTALRADAAALYIKTIYVDGGSILKRWLPAPQGRAYKIRKRSNHVTVIVDARPQQEQPAAGHEKANRKRRPKPEQPQPETVTATETATT